MRILARLLLLLGSLLTIFVAVATLLELSQRREAEAVRAGVQVERRDLLDRLVRLRGRSLYEFARDYSLWDDMVDFLRSGDRAWAVVNIDASLPNFDAQAAWVLRADGTVHYSVTAPDQPELADLLPHEPAFLDLLRTDPEQHFFVRSAHSMVEIRTAPILPSSDVQRQQEPRGWFAVARRWDARNLDTLAHSLQSRVTLDVATPPESPATIQLTHPVRDWRGARVTSLHLNYSSPTLVALLAGSRNNTRLLYAFGALNLLAIALGGTLWFIRPLQLLNRSLASGQREALAPLLSRSDEFGDLARRLAGSFVQRDALQESEARLLLSIELRARLARDLHDGIIQSIYAAGLGLESLPRLRANDPAAADKRLASCQQMLNETLWQIRNFIGALEPESDRRQTTSQSIATLAASLQALQSVPIAFDIDQAAAARMGPTQELQLLQMLRELLSNALRHSGAQQIRVSLRGQPGAPNTIELIVTDDGVGFDPAQDSGSGRGLRNLAARAREIDGQFEITSSIGKGTRIAVVFRAIQ